MPVQPRSNYVLLLGPRRSQISSFVAYSAGGDEAAQASLGPSGLGSRAGWSQLISQRGPQGC